MKKQAKQTMRVLSATTNETKNTNSVKPIRKDARIEAMMQKRFKRTRIDDALYAFMTVILGIGAGFAYFSADNWMGRFGVMLTFYLFAYVMNQQMEENVRERERWEA